MYMRSIGIFLSYIHPCFTFLNTRYDIGRYWKSLVIDRLLTSSIARVLKTLQVSGWTSCHALSR